MARLALPVVTLTLALAACGGSDSRAQPADAAQAAAAARAPIAVFTPTGGKVLAAQPYVAGRLHTVVRVTGRAAPGQQLSLLGSCGGYSCDGITFADSTGRWRTRVELVTPSKRKKAVTLTVAYADARSGERPASVAVTLRKAPAPPQAAPEQDPPPSTTSTTGGQPAPSSTGGSTTPYTGARTMIVIGDSLAIGMAGTLRSLLPDWDVPVDGRTGRPLAEGMQILAETPMPTGSRGSHAILAFSLGTNDGPESADALEAAVRRSMTYLGAHGCALWATIARPPLGGVSYAAMNDRLLALAQEPELYGRLLVIPWKREYDRHKSWRRGDGVHATPEGYAGRAQLYAQAASGCPA
ncbi:MAG: hypothetical protein JWM73_2966 [Solirubrobacterales bacterium]|nr:hypothetical protein [Solirubrobacterales bacterium]